MTYDNEHLIWGAFFVSMHMALRKWIRTDKKLQERARKHILDPCKSRKYVVPLHRFSINRQPKRVQ